MQQPQFPNSLSETPLDPDDAIRNRWLRKCRYRPMGVEPKDEGISFVALRSAGTPLLPTQIENSVQSSKVPVSPSWLTRATPYVPLATALIGLLATLISIHILNRRIFFPTPAFASDSRLAAIKIERAKDASGAQHLLDTLAPSASMLFHRWNSIQGSGGSARRTHGLWPQPDEGVFYVPVPRPNLEQLFQALQDKPGFAALQLQIIHVPASWTAKQLELEKYGWAHRCHIESDWISLWSQFKDPGNRAELKDDCKPGGVCLVISDGPCDAGAFDDVDSGKTT